MSQSHRLCSCLYRTLTDALIPQWWSPRGPECRSGWSGGAKIVRSAHVRAVDMWDYGRYNHVQVVDNVFPALSSYRATKKKLDKEAALFTLEGCFCKTWSLTGFSFLYRDWKTSVCGRAVWLRHVRKHTRDFEGWIVMNAGKYITAWPFHLKEIAAALMVIPRSLSWSMKSITVSPSCTSPYCSELPMLTHLCNTRQHGGFSPSAWSRKRRACALKLSFYPRRCAAMKPKKRYWERPTAPHQSWKFVQSNGTNMRRNQGAMAK